MSDLLQRLRAYAAANPTDVKVICEGIQVQAELEAYAALAQLAQKWRRRQDARLRTIRAIHLHAAPETLQSRHTLRGIPTPELDHEPFPLVRRVVKVCGVCVPAPRGPSASWPGW